MCLLEGTIIAIMDAINVPNKELCVSWFVVSAFIDFGTKKAAVAF